MTNQSKGSNANLKYNESVTFFAMATRSLWPTIKKRVQLSLLCGGPHHLGGINDKKNSMTQSVFCESIIPFLTYNHCDWSLCVCRASFFISMKFISIISWHIHLQFLDLNVTAYYVGLMQFMFPSDVIMILNKLPGRCISHNRKRDVQNDV